MAVSYEDFISYVKDKAERTEGKIFASDEEAYKYGRFKLPHITISNPPHKTNQVYNVDDRADINQSPDFFDYLDYGIDEGSADWKKAAWVNSLSGQMEDWLSDDPARRLKFDAADYERNKTWMQDIGSSLLGFVMPLDLATFYGGGKVGGLAIKQLTKRGAIEFSKKPAWKLGQGEITKEMWNRAMAQGLSGGVTLGTYSGAMGYVGAKAQGADDSEAIKSMIDGVMHGGGLGFLSGGVAGGMGAKYAQLSGKKALTDYEKWIKALTGKKAQFATEAGIFTVAGTIDEMAANHAEKSFLDILKHQAIHNVGFIGGMKIGHAALGKAGRAYDDFSDVYFKNRQSKLKNKLEPIDETIKNIEKDITAENAEALKKSQEPLKKERASLIEKENAIVKEIDDAIKLNKELLENSFDMSMADKQALAEMRTKHAQEIVKRLTNESAFKEEIITDLLKEYKNLSPEIKKELIDLGLTSQAKVDAKIKELQRQVEVNNDILKVSNESLKYQETEVNRAKLEEKAKALGIELVKEQPLEVLGARIEGKQEAITPKTTGTGDQILKTVLDIKEKTVPVKGTKMTESEISKKQEDYRLFDKEVDTKGDKITLSETDIRAKRKLNTPTSKKTIEKASDIDKLSLVEYTREQYSKVGDNTASAYVGEVIKYIEHAKSKGLDVHRLKVKDLKEFISSRRSMHHNQITGLRNYIEYLAANDYISGSKRRNLMHLVEIKNTEINDKTISGPAAREGVRKFAKQKAKTRNDKLVTELSADYGIRGEEISRIEASHIKQTKKGDYYIDLSEIKKFKTMPRQLWIPDVLAKNLQLYLKKNKLSTTSMSRLIKNKSDMKGNWFNDLRKRIATIMDQKLNDKDYRASKWMLGHEKTRLDKIYRKSGLEFIIAKQKEIHKKLGTFKPTKDTKITKAKFQKEGETKLPVLDVRSKAFKKITTWVQDTHPDLILRVEANLGKKDGQAVLGKITNHVIKIAEGKARLDTIPHEVSHHVVDVLKAIGGKQSKKIIKQGIELFGTEEKLVDALGKRVADRILTSRKGASWAKKVWSHIKSFLGIASKKDVLRILGEEVYSARRMARIKQMYPNLNIKAIVKSEPQFQTEKIKVDIKGLEKAKELNEQYGLTENVVNKRVKEGFGVDNLSRLSKIQLKRYRGMLADANLKKSEIRTSADDVISLANYNNISQEAKAYKRAIMPVHFVLEKFGGNPGRRIAEKILEHTYKESQIYGAADMIINNIEGLLPRKDMDKLYLALDKTRYKERAKEGLLNASEEAFVKKANTKGTKEYEAVKEHKKLTNMFWKMLDATAKRHRNAAEYEKFQEKFGDKYIEDYYTRRLTRKAIEILNPSAKFMDKVVANNITEMIKNKGKDKSPEWISNMLDMKKGIKDKTQEYRDFENKARADLYEAITFAPSQVKNPYLLKRMPKLPERIRHPETGKYIETYERKFSDSTERYVGTMSKFLATADIFPEYTYIGGKYTRGRAKSDILQLSEKKDTMANYAALGLSRQLGLSFDIRDALNRSGNRVMGQVAHASAVMGLSSPLSGIKNLTLGIIQNFSTYGIKNTLIGMSKMFSEEAQRDARIAGAIEFGGKHREFSGTGMRLFFKINLMGKTEMWNRIAARISGDLALQETIARVRSESMFLRNYKKGKAEDKLKGIWKLSDFDINFLKTSKIQTKGEIARYNEILNRGKHFSHIASQGGTGTPFLPLWMSGKSAKPFTLFQRMAYSVSYHTWRNFYQPAVKYGNFAPMGVHFLASLVGGQALYGLITNILGVEPPKSQSKDALETAAMYLWKAEYLGMLNEVLSPYMAEDGVRSPIMTPVILRHMKEGASAFAKYFSGVLNEEQFIKTLFTNTTPLISQGLRIKDLNTKPLFKGMKKAKVLENQYWNAMGRTPSQIESWSRRQPYYTDLNNAFIGGDEKQMAHAYWAAYDYIFGNLVYQDGHTPKAAHKEAKSTLKGKITRMNPISLSEDKDGRWISRRNEFLNWLDPESKKELLKYENMYGFRTRKFWSAVDKYRNKYSAYVK